MATVLITESIPENGSRARKRRAEIWRCRCGADGVVKIVHMDGRYRIYCLGCL